MIYRTDEHRNSCMVIFERPHFSHMSSVDVYSPSAAHNRHMKHRLLPVMVVLGRATPELDVSLPWIQTGLGLVVGLIAFTIGMCWRITTPGWAVPISHAVQPIGQQ
jgi:hypothetical protein